MGPALILALSALGYAAVSIAVCCLVHRDEPAGMPRVVRDTAARALTHLPRRKNTRKHRRTA